jgi:hypothetical protein
MDKRSNAANHNLCHFSYSDGRRCRMLRHRDHPGLCPFHSREERQRIESERIGTELAASLTGNYLTASDINHVLGKVFTALAQDRISIKKAKALAWIAQLMLHSLRWAKNETQIRYSWESWQRMLKNSTHLPDPLPATPHDFAEAVFATAEARAASQDRPSPNGDRAHTSAPRSSPNVGARFSASPSAASGPSPAATWDRHSPNGACADSERSGDFTSPSENVGAAGPEERGKNMSPSRAASESVSGNPNGAACPGPVGAADRRGHVADGAADADGRARLQPCQKHDQQDTHLSSPDPRQRNSGGRPGTPSTDESNHEDNTEEPALAGAGPDHRRGS